MQEEKLTRSKALGVSEVVSFCQETTFCTFGDFLARINGKSSTRILFPVFLGDMKMVREVHLQRRYDIKRQNDRIFCFLFEEHHCKLHSSLSSPHTHTIMVQVQKPVEKDAPPPPGAILAVYTVLGTACSFFLGRDPSSSLELRDIAPVLAVLSAFLAHYSLWDVMGTGLAKRAAGHIAAAYPVPETEASYLAQRAQTNQVEQLPVIIVASLSCALLVNGTVAAVLTVIWSLLRIRYAQVYRASAGKSFEQKQLATYTVPAYFMCGIQLLATIVQVLRMTVA